MLKKNLFVMVALISLLSMSADHQAYQIYNQKGKAISFSEMTKELQEADIVFFGELHNNAIAHWLELELAKSLFELRADDLIIGAEMYESDQQLLVDEYLQKRMPYKTFKEQARLWDNDETDYSPILDFARNNKIPFIATNVPRRYAALVNKAGFAVLDSLSELAKGYIAPLPIVFDPEVACYKEMISMMGGHSKTNMSNIAKAQALKDATMAHFILQNWNKGKCFYHFNGSYHSDNHEGIVWYLKKQNPKLKIVTISTREQSNVDLIDQESLPIADFILVVDEDITKTY
jgi:uncharacterized iron-regulated protein